MPLQASTLIFERIYPLQSGGAAAQGDFEIVVDELSGSAPVRKGETRNETSLEG